MEYTVHKLAKMSGVSPRTLRYYDEIGLLKPARVAASGYRLYGRAEVDCLQQILFYRELGFGLKDIKKLLSAADFDRARAFQSHLAALQNKRERLDALIQNVTRSYAAMQGEGMIPDQEKFTGFKQALIAENEREYGPEIRAKYGDKVVDESNAKLNGLSREEYERGEALRLELETALKAAFADGDPGGELARQACDLHRHWLEVHTSRYSKEYHRALGEMYVADERFRANYDKIAPGCAEFFRDALNIYCA